jgi:putative salt-induced outer membrane protein YdiY
MNSRRFMVRKSYRQTPGRRPGEATLDHALHTRLPMNNRLLGAFAFFAVIVTASPNIATAQTPPPPPPGWTGSASAGLALTQGNSDTSTVNAAYELKHDAGGPMVLKSAGLVVWGKAEGELTSDRLALSGRLERRLSERTAVFGQTQYLRDSFKAIDYLISPNVGVTQILFKNDRTELNVDGGVGVVWEKNTDLDLQTDGAVTGGQQFTHKLTATTELKERVNALWKMDDFGDALYTFGIGLAASISTNTQMKFEVLDTYKTRPPAADIKKNDVAVLLSFVYKFE